ncbi:hypothetical protein C2R22_16945 [Salinigranum rubrum]|uniref:Uncharacterized protein n=1 Tax=Salinigranum rubrum TaxID=755307 RepID=A0A2I8VMK5_9EURY|nr:hypothetical protein [Salinigranum rubrum]AUV83125.1 hypothetical protein C2R22_16945 [Salinigranum rubrum]
MFSNQDQTPQSADGSVETSTPVDSGSGDVAAQPIVLAAIGSVLYSWYHFYVQENEAYGLFTGLWAPTLLAFANYLQND